MMRLTRADAFAISGIILFFMLFFWKVFFLGHTILEENYMHKLSPWKYYVSGDTTTFTQNAEDLLVPWKLLTVEHFSRFSIPLWDPYAFSGHPLFANGFSDVLNPFNVLFFLLPFYTAFALSQILYILALGLGTYALIRSYRISPLSAFFGAMVFMLSGTLIAVHANFLLSGYWLFPCILLAIKRFVERNCRGALLALSLCTGITLFGNAQAALYSLSAAVAFAIFLALPSLRRHRRTLARIALAIAIGVGIGAVQLFPTLELAMHTGREGAGAAPLSWLPPWHILNLVAPNFFGDYLHMYYTRIIGVSHLTSLLGLVTNGTTHYPWTVLYVGIAPLVLALAIGFSRRINHQLRFYRWLGGIALLLPMLGFLYTMYPFTAIPILSKFTTVTRMLTLFTFAVAMLAAFALERIRADRQLSRTAFRICLVLFLFAVLLAFSLTVFPRAVPMVSSITEQLLSPYYAATVPHVYPLNTYVTEFFSSLTTLVQQYAFPATVTMLLSTALASLLFLQFVRGKLPGRWFLVLLISLTIADLFSYDATYIRTSPPERLYFETGSLAFLKSDPSLFRIIGLPVFDESGRYIQEFAITSNMLTIYGIQDANGVDPIFPRRYNSFTDLISTQEIMGHVVITDYHSPLIDLLNVKYVLSETPLNASKLTLVNADDLFLYENLNVLPRVFVMRNFTVASQHEILRLMNRTDFNPRAVLFLEVQPEFVEPGQLTASVAVAEYSSNRVSILANLSAPALIVLTDSYFPGWRASVDGVPTPILAADYTFRAVEVPAGAHRIEFSYLPTMFLIGVCITFASLAAALLWYFLPRGRVRHAS